MPQPQLCFEWGGPMHTWAERERPEPTPADRRTLMATAATAHSSSYRRGPTRAYVG
ncbi:hypothetical protein [Streptomyces sp. NPDC015350]|uniref:hypothetical protein n=1 Tax=Streptomyces sp. NPDC015350 TaxID=3364955 RepID=UPI0036F770DE